MKYSIDNTMLSIPDSYKVSLVKTMDCEITSIREENKHRGLDILKRSNRSLVDEWASHNLCYNLGIARSHTAQVDMEYPQKWYFKAAYYLAGLIYRIFY